MGPTTHKQAASHVAFRQPGIDHNLGTSPRLRIHHPPLTLQKSTGWPWPILLPPHPHNTYTDLTTRPCSHYTTHCGNQYVKPTITIVAHTGQVPSVYSSPHTVHENTRTTPRTMSHTLPHGTYTQMMLISPYYATAWRRQIP